jgi:hypothetical protein
MNDGGCRCAPRGAGPPPPGPHPTPPPPPPPRLPPQRGRRRNALIGPPPPRAKPHSPNPMRRPAARASRTRCACWSTSRLCRWTWTPRWPRWRWTRRAWLTPSTCCPGARPQASAREGAGRAAAGDQKLGGAATPGARAWLVHLAVGRRASCSVGALGAVPAQWWVVVLRSRHALKTCNRTPPNCC